MLWELINDSEWLVSVFPPSFHEAKSNQQFSFKVRTAAWCLSFSQPLSSHRSVLEDLITILFEIVANNYQHSWTWTESHIITGEGSALIQLQGCCFCEQHHVRHESGFFPAILSPVILWLHYGQESCLAMLCINYLILQDL